MMRTLDRLVAEGGSKYLDQIRFLTNVEWMPAKSIYFANPDHHDLELGALIEQRQQQNSRRNLPAV